MFEVGKRYTYSDSGVVRGSYILECVYADNDTAYFKYIKGSNGNCYFTQKPLYFRMYPEYKEPKVVKVTRYVGTYLDDDIGTWSKRENTVNFAGSFELTVTDGKLTDVRIVE